MFWYVLFTAYRLDPVTEIQAGHSQEVSFRSASGYRTRLCQLGENIDIRWLLFDSKSLKGKKIGEQYGDIIDNKNDTAPYRSGKALRKT